MESNRWHQSSGEYTGEAAARAAYLWVDTATGGVHNRNHVMPLADYRPPKGAADCYATWMRFTEDLASYARTNSNSKTGRPSVAGYPGPCWAEFFPFDFDSEADPSLAVCDAARFVQFLEAQYRVPADVVRIYWSGNKGISLELSATLFGGFEQSPHLAAVLKERARFLLTGYPTGDLSIYEKLRLWRVPNTRHGKSGLFKVPITTKELFAGDLEAIRELARAPRHLAGLEAAPQPQPLLVNLLTKASGATAAARGGTAVAPRPRGWVAPTLEHLSQGSRNVDLFAVACRLRSAGFTVDETVALLAPHAEHAGFPLDELAQLCGSSSRYPMPNPRPGGTIYVA